MEEVWISRGCDLSDVPTWSATQHPKVWPWVDLLFCSSRRHINRGIIPLMLKLSFVHILLASTWVARSADKWLFQPPTPPTSRSTNQKSLSSNAGPSLWYLCTQHWAGSNIWEGISPSGTRRWNKITTCTFYCNWWPISTLTGSFRNRNTHQCFWICVLWSK